MYLPYVGKRVSGWSCCFYPIILFSSISLSTCISCIHFCGLNWMHLLSCHHHPPFTTAIAIAHHIPIPGFSLTIHPTFSFRCQSINIMYDEWIISQPKPNQAKPKSSPKRVKFKIGCKLPEAVSAANEIQYNPIGLALLFSFFGIRFPDCSLFWYPVQ